MTDPTLSISSRLRALTEWLNDHARAVTTVQSLIMRKSTLTSDEEAQVNMLELWASRLYSQADALDLLIPACEVLEQQVKDLESRGVVGVPQESEPAGSTASGNELASALFRILPMSSLIGVLNHTLRSHDDWGAMSVPRRHDHGDCFSIEFDRFTRAQVQNAHDYLVGIEAGLPSAGEAGSAPVVPTSSDAEIKELKARIETLSRQLHGRED